MICVAFIQFLENKKEVTNKNYSIKLILCQESKALILQGAL